MKDVYVAPEALPVIFISEALVCTSPTGIGDYGTLSLGDDLIGKQLER